MTRFNACQPLLALDDKGETDYGQVYHVKLMARFKYAADNPNDPDTPRLRQEAIDSLANLRRDQFGVMGTNTIPNSDGLVDGLINGLATILTDGAVDRKGDYDTLMNAFIPVLYRHGHGPGGDQSLPVAVYDHVLSLMDMSQDVETFSIDLDPLIVCPLLFLAPGGLLVGCPACDFLPTAFLCLNPLAFAGCCALTVGSQSVTVPETENHLNNIYAAQYLTNQLLFLRTSDPRYNNDTNGYSAKLLARLASFIRNDFVEYNSHPYQDYTTTALLNLASYAGNTKVKLAANMALDYVSAKVAVSSNNGRRSTPFRRKRGESDANPDASHNCPGVLFEPCADPQTGYYMMLAGNTEMLPTEPDGVGNLRRLTSMAYQFQWAAVSGYRVPRGILDLIGNYTHRNFYQFLHYCNTNQLRGSQDCSEELYFGSPSFLISAGGQPTDLAYRASVPLPASLLAGFLKDDGRHPGQEDDRGVVVPTVLMPTGQFHSRTQMIRFSQTGQDHGVTAGGRNMCVAPNFACGLNPVVPADTYPDRETNGPWTFINKGPATAGDVGYYVAVYQKEGFGFFEVYDTRSDPSGLVAATGGDLAAAFGAFKAKVLQNNGARPFAKGENSYLTVAGVEIRFRAADSGSDILLLNGQPPYDPTRTNGTVINADGQGLVTIENPALGLKLTLDARDPQNPTRTVSCSYVVDQAGGGTHTSIQAAVDAMLDPGPCEILVKAGTYNESVVISGKNTEATEASQGAVIRAEEPWLAIVTPAGLPGAGVRHAFTLNRSKFITIEGFKVTGATQEAIYVRGDTPLTNQDITIKNNEITGNGKGATSTGVFVGRENPNTLVEGNRIHRNGGNAVVIEADEARNRTNSPKYVRNNMICRNGWNGVSIGRTAVDVVTLQDNQIHCNGTAAGPTGGRFGVFRQTVAPTNGAGYRQNMVLDGNQLCRNSAGDIAFVNQTLGPPGNDADNVTTLGNEERACLAPGCAGAITGACAVTDCDALCP